jgi:proteasome lid subunit RPN8/RPN11
MPTLEEYLAVDARGRVVGGPYRYYHEARAEADKAAGYVKLAEAPPEPPARELGPVTHPKAEDAHARHIRWSIRDGSYVGIGRNTDTLYEIRPSVLSRGKKPKITWSLFRANRKVDVSSHAERLMKLADEMESDTVAQNGAAERAPVVYESEARCPPAGGGDKGSDAGDCVAIVERTPGCASSGRVLTGARDVWILLEDRYRRTGKEIFEVILLNLRSEMIGSPVQVAVGQRDRVVVDIEQILSPIVKSSEAGCVAVIVVHLHPSGNAKPSGADRKLTESIRAGMKIVCPGTALVDHVIVAPKAQGGTYYSFTEDKTYRVK